MVETKNTIYDELTRVLTDYEEMSATEDDLYDMLCKIQNRWEDVITADQCLTFTLDEHYYMHKNTSVTIG